MLQLQLLCTTLCTLALIYIQHTNQAHSVHLSSCRIQGLHPEPEKQLLACLSSSDEQAHGQPTPNEMNRVYRQPAASPLLA